MSFFESPPPPPEPPERDDFETPEWFGPPRNVLGAPVPIRLVLARTRDVVLAVTDATAYPKGFDLTLAVRSRPPADDDDFDPFELDDPFTWRHRRRRGRGEIPPEFLRFGIEFADGEKATNLGGPFTLGPEKQPEGPVLMPHSGGGGGGDWDQKFWVWPLPPPGPLAFVCEWPAKEIELTRKEIDAQLVRGAAEHAETLWETRRGRWSTWPSGSATVRAVATSKPDTDEPRQDGERA